MNDKPSLTTDLGAFIKANVKEQFTFSGLAGYYNSVRYAIVKGDVIAPIKEDGTYVVGANEWFVAVGRFKVLVMDTVGVEVTFSDDLKNIRIKKGGPSPDIEIVEKSDLPDLDPVLDGLRYGHMPWVLAKLCKLVETAVLFINHNLTSNWGLAVIVYAFLLKVVLIPLDILTNKVQKTVSDQKNLLAPKTQGD